MDDGGRVVRANAAARALAANSEAVRAFAQLAAAGARGGSVTVNGRPLQVDLRPSARGRVVVCVRASSGGDNHDRIRDEKLASASLMAAGVAQELESPSAFVTHNLRALGDFLEILRESAVNPGAPPTLPLAVDAFIGEARIMLEECQLGMDRILTTVRALGSFMQTEDERTAEVPPNPVVDGALRMLRHDLLQRARVERELAATLPVRCSAPRLGQVMLGLLVNAVQSLEVRHARRNWVRVRSLDERRAVVIEVSHNGASAPRDSSKGAGLGLAIAREIVRSAGGGLEIEAREGEGTMFRVRIPAARALHPTPTPVKAVANVENRRARVLIVDDEPLLLKACARMMSRVIDVETAEGAERATAVLERDRAFDAVICDLMMPNVSGMDFYREVKKRWPDVAARFVFATGGVYTTSARQFLENEGRPWLEKPVHLKDLMSLLERVPG